MKHYLALFVKIFAVALFLYSIAILNRLLQIYLAGFTLESEPYILVTGLNFLVPLFLSIIFWKFPKLITKKIYNGDENFGELHSMPLLASIIAGTGIFYLFHAFSDAMYWLVFMSSMNGSQDTTYIQGSMEHDYTAAIVVTAIELILALILILKCKSIAKWTSKISS